ncbi:ribosomal RNA-processing protein 7 homolog A isoform X2 [Pseudophryne corroboree]|uniref:ribosomal RNA-processing protein 7 homolog A isoform X2 n=1 Tax=Pseudophryne corroboree TaxID=495146 RepID=UPI003081CF52
MAPSREESTLASPAGYTAIPVKFSEERKSHHCLYAKEHKVRGDLDKIHPQNRTLFVINIPTYLTEKGLSRIFGRYGHVQSVELFDKPGPSVKDQKVWSKYFHLKAPKGFKVAYIVFKNASRIQAIQSMKVHTPLVISEKDNLVKTGLHKWIEDYKESLIDVVDLQAEIDQYMQEFDKRVAQKEEKEKEEEGMPDEDGWVTVTRKGRRPGLARTEMVNLRLAEKEKKKRAQKELLNFYAWQHRNSKKEHLAELRKKFEEDKQKIALMRAQRKFRPY